MGFIDSNTAPVSQKDMEQAYVALSSGDSAGAWMLLKDVKEGDPAHALYNRTLCLLDAGRFEDALESCRTVNRVLTENVPQRQLDPIGKVLLRKSSSGGFPAPMAPAMPSANPTYAGIMSRWLLCVCLMSCGRSSEADSVASQLERYGIKPIWIQKEE